MKLDKVRTAISTVTDHYEKSFLSGLADNLERLSGLQQQILLDKIKKEHDILNKKTKAYELFLSNLEE